MFQVTIQDKLVKLYNRIWTGQYEVIYKEINETGEKPCITAGLYDYSLIY